MYVHFRSADFWVMRPKFWPPGHTGPRTAFARQSGGGGGLTRGSPENDKREWERGETPLPPTFPHSVLSKNCREGGGNNFYVPERSFMYLTVSCWFIISFEIQVYCTGHGGGGGAVRADPLLGPVGGGWALEISSFLGLKWHSPIGLMPFHRAQKTLDFQGPAPSHLSLVIDLHTSKTLHTGRINNSA
jgi:hypothetical protein